MLSTDYTGRVLDIDMFGISDNPNLEEVSLTFGSGAVVAGPYKEAQKFLRILLSDPNTLLGSPEYGAGLFTKISQGLIPNEAQLRTYFTGAAAQALDFLNNAKFPDGTRNPRFLDDEIITDVSIRSLSITPGVFKLTLKFTFIDTNIDIILPVGISVGT